MRDNRIALKNGSEIVVTDGKRIKIDTEVGRGASCIVYDAAYTDSIGIPHHIRIKECYPYYIPIERTEGGSLIPFETNKDKFSAAKNHFIQAYQRNVSINNTLGLTNSTINSTDFIQYNNTCYIVMVYSEGCDYNKYQDQSLLELFGHIKSLAQLIKKYHDRGYLHLDIKPENILILPETQQHLLLFDFDTVTTIDEIGTTSRFGLAFSEGFSPPEQIQGKRDKIGTHTDIFSIGALMYYKLFGRKVTLDACKIFCSYSFDEMRYFDKKYQPKLYKVLENFLKKTLSASIIPRWNKMQQLIDCLDELIVLSDVDGEYLIDSFQYNTAHFIGREKEIVKIYDKLSENQLIFLSGIGGIGKTEIAKQYANQYRNLYDTVVFAVFDSDIESLVNKEIMINHVEQGEKESDTDYFNRKINVLRRIVTDRDLLIIDNFDTDSDNSLEILLSCPCKFIITSRMDFCDYNYEQIDIDRMENIDDVLKLFYVYNDNEYGTENAAAVKELVEYVGYHTMTVELLAKYLRVSGEAPMELLSRFMEQEGITNTKDINVRQRKDRRLRSESINSHLMTLFDISGFEETEKEIIGSLSLYAGIRIKKCKFEEICPITNISEILNKLIKSGWITYNAKTGKISLHQVIQDLIYKNLSPNAENCPNVVAGMTRYITADTADYYRIKQYVIDVFMDRITGSNISYARLCLLYHKKDRIDEAERICLQRKETEKEAYDILQRICRRKIEKISLLDDVDESELELDDYVVSQLQLIEELMDSIMDYCQRYTDDVDYIVKEYTDACSEIYSALSNYIWCYFDAQNPNMDRICYKLIVMYDAVTRLLPLSSYAVEEKVSYYIKIRDFYMDEDFGITYKNKFFSDIEKAYWYQERIDELRNKMDKKGADIIITDGGVTTYHYTNDVSYTMLAEKYEEEENYERAITFYKKSYDYGDGRYDSVMQSIAHIYEKMGEPKKAVECLEKVLDYDKANENDPNTYFSYTSYICVELIKSFVKMHDYEKAKMYALELIHYDDPNTLKEENSYAVTNVLAAYFYLYFVENESEKKELLWQQCIKYYKMLENDRIDDDILDFIDEYLIKENVCFEEIIKILDRIDKCGTKDIREKIIQDTIAKYNKVVGFDRYHVILMIEYASLFNKYPYESIKKAEDLWEKAQKLYLEYGLNDNYIQNLLYKTRADIMSNDSDYEYNQVLTIKKQCDYYILAQRQLEKAVDDENKMKIWKSAADFCGCADNYEMQIDCLKKSLEIIIPVLNLYEFSKFDGNYQYMMWDMIRAYIQLEDYENAKHSIDELYERTVEFYLEIENSDNAQERIWKMRFIANSYLDCFSKEKAVNIYLVAIYIGLEEDRTKYALLRTSNLDVCRVSQLIVRMLAEEIDSNLKDSLIELKDELVSNREAYNGDIDIFDEIVSTINEHYQNREIEFKSFC
ncbi:MAG: serine/threonine protein kinase [Lachnospiraceae bacterium]|nr:serine/threonine protein kinase [Lachnospiraceae bacterium]